MQVQVPIIRNDENGEITGSTAHGQTLLLLAPEPTQNTSSVSREPIVDEMSSSLRSDRAAPHQSKGHAALKTQALQRIFWMPAVRVPSLLPGSVHRDGCINVLGLRFIVPQIPSWTS